MLGNLFRLDGTPTTIGAGGPMPSMSPGDCVSNIVFDQRRWEAPQHRHLRRVTFRNVAFSKATFSRITFTDCIFEDCLFIGARFREVDFHGCQFLNCNFWKVHFRNAYLDPDTINFEHRFRVEAANIGISVFQALLSNFAEDRQDHFYMIADIRFRRWKRFQIWSDIRRKRIGWMAGVWKWIGNLIYEVFAGYGYRPLRFIFTTITLFLGTSLLNHCLIGDALQINGVNSENISLVDSVFYTFSILTVLGFSSIIPTSETAKLLTVFEALAAVGWLGIFTAMLVKRFLR